MLDSMDSGDRLLVGIELWNQNNMPQVQQQYEFTEMFALVFTTLEYLGAKQSDGFFKVIVDQYTHEIKIIFEFKRDWEYTLPFNMHGRTITVHFGKGDPVQLATSRRFTGRSLSEMLARVKFSENSQFYDETGTFSILNLRK